MKVRRKRVVWGVVGAIVGAIGFVVVLNFLPERRDLRGPIEHRFAVADAQFLRTMNGAFGGGLTGGNNVQSLSNGDRIFPAMLAAIEAATDTINFETYIYWSGMIGDRFADALIERARNGVEVRALIDWAGSQAMDQELIRRMSAAGIKVERFRPLRWYTLDRINNRTHRKLLIVDGRVGFTGGVGIGDEWLGDARHPGEWRENHYRVDGPAVAHMQSAFAGNWLEATGEPLLGDRFYPPLAPVGEKLAQVIKSSPTGGGESMHQMLLVALSSASSHIRIGMAYFVPDDFAIAQLLEARSRGVEIDIILPGEEMDHSFVRKASRHFWGDLLRAGVRIYEFQPTMYHCKVLIVDEHWTTVGSANFDERSFRLNDEANLNVHHVGFAREQIALFEADRALSRLVTYEEWSNRPSTDRLRDWIWSHLRPQL